MEKAVGVLQRCNNCAQSVFTAYADLFGLTSEQAFRIASPLGGGMAGMRHVCGAVNAMVMLSGLSGGASSDDDMDNMVANFELVHQMTADFAARHGSIICSRILELKGETTEGPPDNPCVEEVRTAASLVEKYLFAHK